MEALVVITKAKWDSECLISLIESISNQLDFVDSQEIKERFIKKHRTKHFKVKKQSTGLAIKDFVEAEEANFTNWAAKSGLSRILKKT